MESNKQIFAKNLSPAVQEIIQELVEVWNDISSSRRKERIILKLEKLGYMKDGEWLKTRDARETKSFFDRLQKG